MFSFFNKDPSLLEASRKERHDAIDRLISQGTFHSGYYLLLLLATLIVTPGLLLDNVAVIIGGMILAPLLIPLLSISLSLVSGNTAGFIRSMKILMISIVITISTSAILTTILAEAGLVVNWIPDRINTGVYIFIAFCSGVAAAFAWVKENLSSSVAGVAVAVSLLPPLCAVGVGLALRQPILMKNSSILFLANLVGICMAGFLVFWILGFIDSGHEEEKALNKVQNK
ncbi:MAG: DUF389 domain-containing protein [Candidatus Peribacter sp.]|jgi:uncharacterized hydrophobic protein (TIGR00271 family)|nr:DUF389 domain-containing protein [Candidatus Peribacter sp.]MBT4392932.1 DUF389 domain-containing protein [Candidatus Peribacter sp.]MBT4600992.1 DUF389 domain-containing protein [Candidatus Peribacter sp.]MBT5149034.1 DUF389 domain-containing protein [Candidatus Peribacter sp.]MBT5637358.1 DUF389 domain-containing protein [Candidatus Peribacter sp.]